jgi:hypothetical protein
MFKEHSNLILSIEERAKLKAEFNKLETIDQKYDFWKNQFHYDYSQHYSLEQSSIEDFKIIPRNPSETEEINKRLYENYVSFWGDGNSSSPEKVKKEFIEAIGNSLNKEAYIEYEINNIEDFIFRLKHPQPRQKTFGVGYKFSRPASEWFFFGYNQYLINRKEFNWSEKLYFPSEIIEITLGIEWAKYKDFVKNYLKPQRKEEQIKLNGEQKFLVLHYLGFGNDLKANTHKSVLYDFFIEELNANSIRPMLSNIKKYETE